MEHVQAPQEFHLISRAIRTSETETETEESEGTFHSARLEPPEAELCLCALWQQGTEPQLRGSHEFGGIWAK